MLTLNVYFACSASSGAHASVYCALGLFHGGVSPRCLITLGHVLILDFRFFLTQCMDDVSSPCVGGMIVGKNQTDDKGVPVTSVHSSWVLPCFSSLSAHICMMEVSISVAAVWLNREDGVGGVNSWCLICSYCNIPIHYAVSYDCPHPLFKLRASSIPLSPLTASLSCSHYRQGFLSFNSIIFLLSEITHNFKSTEVSLLTCHNFYELYMYLSFLIFLRFGIRKSGWNLVCHFELIFKQIVQMLRAIYRLVLIFTFIWQMRKQA